MESTTGDWDSDHQLLDSFETKGGLGADGSRTKQTLKFQKQKKDEPLTVTDKEEYPTLGQSQMFLDVFSSPNGRHHASRADLHMFGTV